jgi:hypothetical protein
MHANEKWEFPVPASYKKCSNKLALRGYCCLNLVFTTRSACALNFVEIGFVFLNGPL